MSSSEVTGTEREELILDVEEQRAYKTTSALLRQQADFLAPFPSVVSLRDLVEDPTPEGLSIDELPTSLLSSNKGHHSLFRALEELEGLEKEEAALIEHSPLTAPLTEVFTGRPTPSARDALEQLQEFGSIPRRVCQHPFKRNDIVWVCRTCQADETCVLCHTCFSQSYHEGHDVAFYHAQAGGCCDCGDPDAWDPAGFCPHHGPKAHSYNYSKATGAQADTTPPSVAMATATATANAEAAVGNTDKAYESSNREDGNQFPLSAEQVKRVRGVVPSAVDWMVDVIAHNAEAGYQRAVLVSRYDEDDLPMFPPIPGPVPSAAQAIAEVEREQARRQVQAQAVDLEMADNDNHGSITMMEAEEEQQGNENDDNSMHDGVFSPTAASRSSRPQQQGGGNNAADATTSSAADEDKDKNNGGGHDGLSLAPSSAESLGLLGQEDHGLYLVLFADDVHSPSQWMDGLREFLGATSYYTDSLLAKFVRALRQYGQLVVWGSMELAVQTGSAMTHLWLDGDNYAAGLVGLNMMTRAKKLSDKGFFCSIVTRQELQLEQRAVAVLQWMSALARSCDPLCQTVAECILPNRHLAPLLRADFKLSARITKAWYSLLLTLLAVPTFKSHLAAAYCDTYRDVTAKYAAGMGVLERSAYTLSVQFLNRVTYVVDLVQGRDLLGKLGKSLLETLKVAEDPLLNDRLDPNHFVLSHRRYSPCISDLKCVLNVKGMKRLFACQEGTFLQDWMSALSLAQFMDAQYWRNYSQGHVEDEVRGWVGAFNLSISLGSLFERLLSWEDDEPSPIKDPSSPLSRNLLSCAQLTFHIMMAGIAKWQQDEAASRKPTVYASTLDPHKRCPASLPFSTIASKHGCALAFQQIPIAQITPFSFHLPLHRFLAACLREVCLRNQMGFENLLGKISPEVPLAEQDNLFRGLMEFPVLVLTRSSQVRAGLWRRNGPGLNDQVLNYAEPPFCRSMRDADLLLLQFAALKRTRNQSPDPRPVSDVGVSFLIHLLLHRLGIFDVAGLTKAPNSNIDRYLDEISKWVYPGELRPDAIDNDVVLPWSYSPARDAATRLVLLEEFLHLMIIFTVELPPVPPQDKTDHTNQAKQRLRREVIHRLASGPKTHSELSEVHLVLSHWDNVLLSEEGKLVNPDDATGAALGAVLEDVADRKSSRGKLEPDKWELRRSAWEEYDPSFFHVSLRSHQTAAEGRPQPANTSGITSDRFGDAKSYAPVTLPAHPYFERLRRDITADATVLAITYRILHLHCRPNKEKGVAELRGGRFPYESDDRSETALARAVHILTLGAFAWERAKTDDGNWRLQGGGSAGSVFFDRQSSPSASDWVAAALLSDPGELIDCEWYLGEESTISLLRRLAVDGGTPGIFVAQDPSVKSGAAWLCEFALRHCSAAAGHLGTNASTQSTEASYETDQSESVLQMKKRLAKEKALARMKDQAAKFAFIMKAELEDGGDEENDNNNLSFSSATSDISLPMQQTTNIPRQYPDRSVSLGSTRSLSSTSIETTGADSDQSFSQLYSPLPTETYTGNSENPTIPIRLLNARPQCIICNDDTSDSRTRPSFEEDVHRRSRRRKLDGGNALGLVAYAQASTVLRGGGGPPCPDDFSMSPVRRFVGAHVALCGHAVHSDCCEAYLNSVTHREDRVIGKRDEFRCPLCQRLSNCLVPFIDVGEDWICTPTSLYSAQSAQRTIGKTKCDSDEDMYFNETDEPVRTSMPLHDFLSATPWWVTRHNPNVIWDGQSAFVSKTLPSSTEDGRSTSGPHPEHASSPLKPLRRSVRSLRKKDLYAAWNAMMRTPRFVRRKLRNRGCGEVETSSPGRDLSTGYSSDHEESTGETVVWRRFMEQVCDISYRADSKRLGEENLHNDFGEFRHYIVEKFSYNLAKRSAGIDPADWPSCVFSTTLSDTQRQELSREKLLSKLLMTVQSFTYTCCCEAFEAKLALRRHMRGCREVAGVPDTANIEAVYSKFGISGVICDGRLVLLPLPSSSIDGGSQPFNGRIGRLRYFALAVMAAAGAVAADLVQLVLALPHGRSSKPIGDCKMDVEKPDRSPIAYPILLGNVLTHVVAAMSASCGRARARSDSLELVWPVPFSIRGSFALSTGAKEQHRMDSVIEDCEGFVKLGLLARILQVLFARLELAPNELDSISSVVTTLQAIRQKQANIIETERSWMLSCLSLIETAVGGHIPKERRDEGEPTAAHTIDLFYDACVVAAVAGCSYLVDISTVLQVLVPGVMVRYDCKSASVNASEWEKDMSLNSLEKLRSLFQIESLDEMLRSPLVRGVISAWFDTAYNHARASLNTTDISSVNPASSMRSRLFRTQGFRAFDWPMQSPLDWQAQHIAKSSSTPSKISLKLTATNALDESSASGMQIEAIQSRGNETPPAEMLRQHKSPTLVTFSAKKTVPLIGGYRDEALAMGNNRPRVAVVPTSYTDLYAELGALLPECEQTAVCLVCGEVLNAGGKGECTRHSYKCGAGTGLFFLLQECSGLIMHKGKAAYIHSPYVDSHGETPQYRGRPLNLDLARYDHLREVWSGHGVRQQVLAERGSSRQVIVPDFY